MRHEFQCNACKGRYFETSSDGAPYAHVCGPLPASTKNPERERPNKRDENIVVDRMHRQTGIRSTGAGVTCITDGKLEEPRWISALYKRVQAEEEDDDA